MRFEQLELINDDSFLSLLVLDYEVIILGVHFHGIMLIGVDLVEVDYFLVGVDHADLDAVD